MHNGAELNELDDISELELQKPLNQIFMLEWLTFTLYSNGSIGTPQEDYVDKIYDTVVYIYMVTDGTKKRE